MPVLKPITLSMNGVKSAELIQQLKAETEKNVNKQKFLLKPNDTLNMVCIDTGYQYGPKENHLNVLRRNVIPYPDHNYGQQPPLTPPGLASPDPNEQTDTGNEDEDEEGVTRCICGFSHDDGYMICCDKCGSWQHIECMGIKSDNVPDTYLCDRCEPRRLDLDKARAIQMKKKDQLTDDDGDEDTDTEEELRSTSYTAISNTPTRITLTATPILKKKPKNQLKSTNSNEIGNVRKKVNRKRQRASTRQSNEELILDSNSTGSQFCHDSYQQIDDNIYDEVVMNLKLENTEVTINENCIGGCKKLFSVSECQDGKKGLVATEEIKAGQCITEYKGRVLLLTTFEDSSPFFKRSHPFVLYYNGIEKTPIVIDARIAGNEARYIRRSCMPNAEVQHKIVDNKLHVVIICKEEIANGYEITIPFEYPLETYTGYVDCACRQITCLAMKRNQAFMSQTGRKKMKYSIPDASTRNSASENQGETDSDENELDVGSSDRSVSRRKKMSREERKLQAYLKQIEKMEKKEKKVKDPKTVVNRSGSYADLSQSYPQGSCTARLAQLSEGCVPQSPVTPIARRSSSSTPASAKKRISLNKKRPRISSCSSDPLSPEIHNLTISTITPTTPVLESLVASFAVDNNGHAKQKAKKDKEHQLLSVSQDKQLIVKETTRRLRKDFDETRAGSPTPPSTPGQLSPSQKSCDSQSLSVDVTNSLVCPLTSGHHYLSHYDRRNVLNGLLQIVNQADTQSASSGSPVNTSITSNGLVTAEEVMGDIMKRDTGLDTPTERTDNTGTPQECGYYGSLKKRWLVQYDGRMPFQARQLNGISPLSLSALVNDHGIRKRAAQIVAHTFKAPQNSIPPKKRRLRDALGVLKKTDSVVMETNENNEEPPNIINRENRKQEEEVNSVEENMKTDNANNVQGLDIVTYINKKNTIDNVTNDFDDKTDKEALDFSNNTNERNRLENEPRIESRNEADVGIGLVKKNEHNSTVLSISVPQFSASCDVIAAKSNDELEPYDVSEKGNSNDIVVKTDAKEVEGIVMKTEIPKAEKEDCQSVEISTFGEKSNVFDGQIKQINKSMTEAISAVTSIPSNAVAKNVKTFLDDVKQTTDEDFTKQLAKNEDTTKEDIRKMKDICMSSVVSTTTNPTVLTSDNIVNETAQHLSALIRDPRLSSSSSRSSRDSVDNVFLRSDSVSSLDEVTGQKLDYDKKTLSGSVERLDGTPAAAKKKMSLREYRNRKRTKPSSNPSQVSNQQVSDISPVKMQNDSSTVLFTDTEALLTPRTLSLSNSFINHHTRDTVLSSAPQSSIDNASTSLPRSSVVLHDTPRLFNTSIVAPPVTVMMQPASANIMPLSSSGVLPQTPTIPTATSSMHLNTPMTAATNSAMHLPLMHPPVASTVQSTGIVQLQSIAVSNEPMFEPVSPDDDYKTDSGSASQSLQNSSTSVVGMKAAYTVVSTGKLQLPAQMADKVSPCDAMDIEDDESSSSNKIVLGLPNIDARNQYSQNVSQSFNRQPPNSFYHVQKMRELQQQQQQQGNKLPDNGSPSNRQLPGYSQQFR